MSLSTALASAKLTCGITEDPAKVKLVRADINPPRDFDLSGNLPRFSQGNEPPLNLTEKVNKVVMERMRAARNNSKDEPRMTHKASETKGKKPMRNSKGSEEHPQESFRDHNKRYKCGNQRRGCRFR